VTTTLWANGSIRIETGFLALFIAFVIKSEYADSSAFTQLLLLGVVGVAAGIGGFLGNAIGARLPLTNPDLVSISALGAVVLTTLIAALIPGLITASIVGLVGSTASALAKVSLDSVIQARAQGAKALGQKFFLDFAAEMNGDEGWSGNDPLLYVSAYRHIHDIFVTAGATNVVWAWCPNVTDVDNGNSKTMEYYPGDDYVDWTGVDGYNWGNSNGRWQTFKSVFSRIYPLLAAKGKPILIGEMASAEGGGDKGAWIDAIIPTLKADYPLIKGLVWFDVNKENDWRIRSSAGSEAAFVRMAKDPYFNP
jgi:hypothetical protein